MLTMCVCMRVCMYMCVCVMEEITIAAATTTTTTTKTKTTPTYNNKIQPDYSMQLLPWESDDSDTVSAIYLRSFLAVVQKFQSTTTKYSMNWQFFPLPPFTLFL